MDLPSPLVGRGGRGGDPRDFDGARGVVGSGSGGRRACEEGEGGVGWVGVDLEEEGEGEREGEG